MFSFMICAVYPYLTLGYVLSEGSAGYTGYYTVYEINDYLGYLVGNYSDSLTLINDTDPNGVSYGKGDVKILILGGVSSCPLCSIQVLAIAEKLASSIEDNQDENAQNFYKYTQIDMFPLVNIDDYNSLLDNFPKNNKYTEIINDENCTNPRSNCYTTKNKLPPIEDYDILFNIQGMEKNSIIYPKNNSGKRNIYIYFTSFFKGFELKASSNQTFIDKINEEKTFAIQMEVAPEETKFISDYPITVNNAENFCKQLFESCAAIPLVDIKNIYYSIKKVSNNDYNITIPVKITNRYPFTLNTTFIITVLPTLDQQILEFHQSIASMSFNIISQPNKKEKGTETSFSMNITSETYGVIITKYFEVPPYGKIDADFYLLQKPKTYPGGYFNYVIQMISPHNISNTIVLKNFTDNNKHMFQEVQGNPKSIKHLSPEAVMGLMFILFTFIILAIVCCVMIKHKPGWLLG